MKQPIPPPDERYKHVGRLWLGLDIRCGSGPTVTAAVDPDVIASVVARDLEVEIRELIARKLGTDVWCKNIRVTVNQTVTGIVQDKATEDQESRSKIDLARQQIAKLEAEAGN